MHEIERLNPVALRALELDPERHRVGAPGSNNGALDDAVPVVRQVDLDDGESLGQDRIGETGRAVFVPPQPAHAH